MAQVSTSKTASSSPPKMPSSVSDPFDESTKPLKPNDTHSSATTFRRLLPFRRRKLPTVRLGGKKPRKGFFLVRLFRRVKLKLLKNKYFAMIKKLKNYYRSLVKDIIEAGGTMETFQQRILMETSFAVPVMGVSINSFPNRPPLLN